MYGTVGKSLKYYAHITCLKNARLAYGHRQCTRLPGKLLVFYDCL